MEIKIETEKDNEWQNLVKIEGIKLKDIKFVPIWEITTMKTTERFDDAEGNVQGYKHTINKITNIKIYPESQEKEIKPKIDRRFKKSDKK